MEYVNPVEQQLKEAGRHLSFPPSSSSTKDLLQLLDKTEQLLSFVAQAPSISMQGALVPSMGALIGDALIKHSDLDVRIAVASCLCEVARITAPEPPYKEEIMQEIFRLIMVAFGELANLTGQSYYKAIHILESVAKVKICLLMLDLECDDLVLEMFEQFLKNIRASHPHTVFSAMANIMTLVIEESDEIATELLSLLISHVRKEQKDISPVPWKLAEKVLSNCKVILKSYAGTIKELIKSDPGDYAEVVTVLCQNATENELVISKSTKRDLNTLENGGSIKTLIHSHQSKKRKYVDAERVAAVSNKINRHRLKGKQLETSHNLGTSNGSHSAKGQPKKNKNNVIQHNKPKLVQDSQEDLTMTKFQDKSKDPLSQQRNDYTQSSKKMSSKKPAANGSSGKNNPKKFGQDLVGHSIKVWWPLDKMFYTGAVSSFNPTDKKHKVLYSDGDEEVLDLSQERWLMVDDMSRDQDQIAVLPSPVTAPVKHLKQKGKRKLDSAPTQEDNSNPPKRQRSSAYSLRTKPTREEDIKDANTSTTGIICNSEYHKDDPVQTLVIYRGLNSSEKIIEVERDSEPNPGENLEVKRLLVSGQTTEVQQDGELKLSGNFEEKKLLESSQTIEVEQNGEPNPSGCLKEKRLLDLCHTIEMEQDGEPNPSVELEEKMLPEMTKTEQAGEPNPNVKLEEKRMPESSEMINVEQDCELNQRVKLEKKKLPKSSEMIEAEQACEQLPSGESEEKGQPESSEMIVVEQDGKPSPSIELLEKKHAGSSDIIEVEQDGELIPSGELEIKRLAETKETIQRLDKSDGLVSEP